MENVKDYIEPYVALGVPVDYKGLEIYPFLVNQYYDFYCTIDLLNIDKNQIPDIKIIQMTYLQYIIDVLFHQSEFNKVKFYTLFTKVFKCEVDDIKLLSDDSGHYYMKVKNGATLNSTDFEDIRRIVLYQNMFEYDDTPMSADFRKAWNDYIQIKNKGNEPVSLRTKIATLQSLCGLNKKEICEMTLLEFEDVFDSALSWEEYRINHGAEMSGMVKFDKPIEHPVYHKKHDKYAEMFVNADNFSEQLTSI